MESTRSCNTLSSFSLHCISLKVGRIINVWFSLPAINALLTCYGLLTKLITLSTLIQYTHPNIHSYFTYLTLSFCSFTVCLLTFLTDDSDFLTIVTCCLCALIIVSALLVYGSFKVSFWNFQNNWWKFHIFSLH